MPDTATTTFNRSEHVDGTTNKNKHLLVCRLCGCKILKPLLGEFVTSEESLPDAHQNVKKYENWWVIGNMYKFENISFTKLSGQQASLSSSVPVMQGRYMCCADCEREPIGFVKEGNKFYICAELVHYK